MDALIAFKAQKHNLTLLHADRDFDRLSRATSFSTESFASSVGNL
jgi:predicted nucleic acid-binding protein